MDWSSLLVGALAGGIVGVVLQNILFPTLQGRLSRIYRRRHFKRAHQEWVAFEGAQQLKLVQGGWGEDSCFSRGTVTIRLTDVKFEQAVPVVEKFREGHLEEWLDAGLTNGEQVGAKAISITRVSDDPESERAGRAHSILIEVRPYNFFDFLSTHILRLTGSEEERAILDGLVGIKSPEQPVLGFPTPLSIGISIFCEDGMCLVLTRRSTVAGAGGYWAAGKIFNAVGENLAMRDFAGSATLPSESSPEIMACRGLREEMGISSDDVNDAELRIHSLAWASDLLDFKFFGYLRVKLSRGDILERWASAPDRTEGVPFFVSVGTQDEIDRLLQDIRDNKEEWSPEAIFSTIRGLISMRKVTPQKLRSFNLA